MSHSLWPHEVCQAPLSVVFSRQVYWSGVPFPSLGDLPNPGIEPMSLTSPALAGGFFTTAPPGREAHVSSVCIYSLQMWVLWPIIISPLNEYYTYSVLIRWGLFSKPVVRINSQRIKTDLDVQQSIKYQDKTFCPRQFQSSVLFVLGGCGCYQLAVAWLFHEILCL